MLRLDDIRAMGKPTYSLIGTVNAEEIELAEVTEIEVAKEIQGILHGYINTRIEENKPIRIP